VSILNAKFGKDGNQFFYMIGHLPEPDCIVGFGDTPEDALNEFYEAWKSNN
jgi:predicted RNase H-like HicB family nuclease